MAKIGSARISENNSVNGVKGDSTGKEVAIENFYIHELGWYIIRPKTKALADKLATFMKRACENDNIGYSQKDRSAIWSVGTATAVPTNCDCSSLVRQCIIECGIDCDNFTTGNAVSVIGKTNFFEKKVEYTEGFILERGDIIVTKKKGHIAIVIDGDSTSNVSAPTTNSVIKIDHAKSYDKALNKNFVTTGNLYMRVGASVNKNSVCVIPRNTEVRCYGYYTTTLGTKWLLVKYGVRTGFCSEKYLKEV